MIRERIVELFSKFSLNNKDLESKTGISAHKWGNIKTGKQRANEEHIEAINEMYPEYAYWLSTGKTIPEAGQISPDEGNNVIRMENPLEKFLNWVRVRQDKEDYFLALARDLDEGEFAPFRIEARRRYSSRRLTAGLGKTRRQAQPRVKRRV